MVVVWWLEVRQRDASGFDGLLCGEATRDSWFEIKGIDAGGMMVDDVVDELMFGRWCDSVVVLGSMELDFLDVAADFFKIFFTHDFPNLPLRPQIQRPRICHVTSVFPSISQRGTSAPAHKIETYSLSPSQNTTAATSPSHPAASPSHAAANGVDPPVSFLTTLFFTEERNKERIGDFFELDWRFGK
ncbi:hypothetical protein Droror1_Dr00016299 [Drosera rotundifolia]